MVMLSGLRARFYALISLGSFTVSSILAPAFAATTTVPGASTSTTVAVGNQLPPPVSYPNTNIQAAGNSAMTQVMNLLNSCGPGQNAAPNPIAPNACPANLSASQSSTSNAPPGHQLPQAAMIANYAASAMSGGGGQYSVQTSCSPISAVAPDFSCDQFNSGSPEHFNPTMVDKLYGQICSAAQTTQCWQGKLAATNIEVGCLQNKWDQVQEILGQFNDTIKASQANMRTAIQQADAVMKDGSVKLTNLDGLLNGDPASGSAGLIAAQKSLQSVAAAIGKKNKAYKQSKTNLNNSILSLNQNIANQIKSQAASCLKTNTNPAWKCWPSDPTPETAISLAECRLSQSYLVVNGGQADSGTQSLADSKKAGLDSVINSMLNDLTSGGGAGLQGIQNLSDDPNTAGAGLGDPNSVLNTGSTGGGSSSSDGGSGLPADSGADHAVVKGAADTAASPGTALGTGVTVVPGVQFQDVGELAQKYADPLAQFNTSGLPISSFLMTVLANCYTQAQNTVATQRAMPGTPLGMQESQIATMRSTLDGQLTDYYTSFKQSFDTGIDALYPDPTVSGNLQLNLGKCELPDQYGDATTAEVNCLDSTQQQLNAILNGTGGTSSFATTLTAKGTNTGAYPPISISCTGLNNCVKAVRSFRTTYANTMLQFSTAKQNAITTFNLSLTNFADNASKSLRTQSQQIGKILTGIGMSLSSSFKTATTAAQAEMAPAGTISDPDNINKTPYPGLMALPADLAGYIEGRTTPPFPDIDAASAAIASSMGDKQKDVTDEAANLANVPAITALEQKCISADEQDLSNKLGEQVEDASDAGCLDANMCAPTGILANIQNALNSNTLFVPDKATQNTDLETILANGQNLPGCSSQQKCGNYPTNGTADEIKTYQNCISPFNKCQTISSNVRKILNSTGLSVVDELGKSIH